MREKFLHFRETLPWKILKKAQEIVLVVCGALCCLLFVVEVLARYVFKVDFRGYDEIVLLFAVWLYFIGGSYAMYKKQHISADMLGMMLKGKALSIARAVVSWVTFAITVFLAAWGINFFRYALTRTAQTTVWRIPHLCSQSALTLGYILMAFYALVYALEDTFLAGKTEGTEPEGGEK